jgi:hypothetical protein
VTTALIPCGWRAKGTNLDIRRYVDLERLDLGALGADTDLDALLEHAPSDPGPAKEAPKRSAISEEFWRFLRSTRSMVLETC